MTKPDEIIGIIVMIGIPLGLLAGNAVEWVAHKYVLHGLGKSKKSFWSFHWHDHHKNSRRNEFFDDDYKKPLFKWHPPGKELASLSAFTVACSPLFLAAPFFTGTLVYCAVNYYRVHKKSHLDPQWAKQHLPWHYDHHMAPNQDANWCVTKPWFDIIMGTREHYLGTEREKQDREKATRLQLRRQRQRAIVLPSDLAPPKTNTFAHSTPKSDMDRQQPFKSRLVF